MAKQSKANLKPGVSWRPGDKGWVPTFTWKKIRMEGDPRPAKAFMPGEPFQVVMEFANEAGKALFGVEPFHTVEKEGRMVLQTNPAFDEIPTIASLLGGLGDITVNEGGTNKEQAPHTGEAEDPGVLRPVTPVRASNPSNIPADQIDPNT